MQKQWNTLPVTMLTEIMIFLIDYYGGCHGIAGLYLCLAILTNNEECHFLRCTTCLGQTIVIPLFAILRRVVTMSTRFLGTFL